MCLKLKKLKTYLKYATLNSSEVNGQCIHNTFARLWCFVHNKTSTKVHVLCTFLLMLFNAVNFFCFDLNCFAWLKFPVSNARRSRPSRKVQDALTAHHLGLISFAAVTILSISVGDLIVPLLSIVWATSCSVSTWQDFNKSMQCDIRRLKQSKLDNQKMYWK